MSQVLKGWNQLSGLPFGKHLFSRLVSSRAPYFKSIGATFADLRPGYAEITLRNRKKVHNHIGTVHAIAMCNLAELVGGTVTDATIPATHRWIPKGMTVEYLNKAETDLRAIAELDPAMQVDGAQELPVEVQVLDAHNVLVFRAVITMWLTPKS